MASTALTPAQMEEMEEIFRKLVFGPVLVGSYFAGMFYGLNILQAHNYFNKPHKDACWIRVLVVIIIVLDGVLCSLNLAFVYEALILKPTSLETFTKPGGLMMMVSALTGLVETLVQIFFAWRVKVLSRNLWLTAAILALSIIGLATSVAVTAIGWNLNWSALEKVQVPITIWSTSTVACDLLISVTMVWYLSLHKRAFAKASSVIDKFVQITIPTCLLVTAFAFIDMIAYVTTTKIHIIYSLVVFLLSKMHTNAMLSDLNSMDDSSLMTDGETSSTGQSGEILSIGSDGHPTSSMTDVARANAEDSSDVKASP